MARYPANRILDSAFPPELQQLELPFSGSAEAGAANAIVKQRNDTTWSKTLPPGGDTKRKRREEENR